ncbi:hypothetical protein SASPL_107348 [Salvia splendens]|uniref:urease n=1 Tax=Salvia splendens TaxID=180675 RepID=A0A8X8YA70_SALSN|nr:hypothetical protein SASPL_107348 [Salvia splendens]
MSSGSGQAGESQILEFVWDGDKSVVELMDLGRQLLGRRQVLPSVPYLLDSVQVEGTFPDGTKLITIHDPVACENGNLELALHGSFLPAPSLDKFPPVESCNIPGELICGPQHLAINLGRKGVVLKVTNTGDRPVQVIISPGDTKSVSLVSISGNQIIRGGNNLVDAPVNDSEITSVMTAVHEQYGFSEEADAREFVTEEGSSVSHSMSRDNYANIVFGGGKVLRDGMGQACGYQSCDCLETVITNAVVIDYTGIFKADIGIKNGYITSIGKAGNPDIMHGVSNDMIIGVNTEVIAGEGMIVTAGAIDCHVHFICPQLAFEAITSGITTLVGGGTGPAHGTLATTCTPGPFHMKLMLQSTDDMPLNFGFTGKGNSAKEEGLHEIIKAGAMGLKLHEDWQTTPVAIDKCLTVADLYDIQVNIHTDTLNESGFVEHTIAAFKDRTIHTYHSEGAGGGHAPDIIKVCGVKNVLPSSTNPTRPFTINTVDEHLDMLMVCHHLDKDIKEDVAFAEQWAALERTWQTAHKMKLIRGELESSTPGNDNLRIKRYIAKYTINPAIANGFSEYVGSVEVGKLADLVIWKPAFFGVKPEMVIKGGTIAWSDMGDPNASIPTPEPVKMRPMFGAFGKAASSNSVAFVSKAALDAGVREQYGLKKRVEAVSNVRKLTKLDMKLNDALPHITVVDPETYTVTADGEVLTTLPLSRNYFLF